MWIRDRLGRRIYNNDQVCPKCNKEYDVTANYCPFHSPVSLVEKELEKDGDLFSLRGQTISWSESLIHIGMERWKMLFRVSISVIYSGS